MNCFQLLGYPEWWGDRPRTERKGAGRGKLASSGVGGGKEIVRANAAIMENGPGTTVGQTSAGPTGGSVSASVPLPGFSAEQWRALVAAFGNPQSSTERMNGPSLEEADWNG
ncbi:uncharacterized protein LOC109827919 [Asparagus officinalis]|uniref:uncharacterized protein LOC109827919 n=1 Tax=Asparagus officinalis TaxID=4686 RepID=UPI00098E4E6B|nr:uncharacterized protein LOC109827919 [Asparagus officinalis]